MGESQARSAVWQTSRAVKLDLLLGEQETCWGDASHWPKSQKERADGNSDSLATTGERKSANAVLVQGSRWPLRIRQHMVPASPLPARSCCHHESSTGPAASSCRGRERGEAPEGLKWEGSLWHRIALQRGTLSTSPPSSWPPPSAALPARPEILVAAALGGRLPAKDHHWLKWLSHSGRRVQKLDLSGKALENEHCCFPVEVLAGDERGVV